MFPLLGWDVIFASISNTLGPLGLKMVEPYEGTGQKLKAFPFCLPYALAGIVSWVMHLLILKKIHITHFQNLRWFCWSFWGGPKIFERQKINLILTPHSFLHFEEWRFGNATRAPAHGSDVWSFQTTWSHGNDDLVMSSGRKQWEKERWGKKYRIT